MARIHPDISAIDAPDADKWKTAAKKAGFREADDGWRHTAHLSVDVNGRLQVDPKGQVRSVLTCVNDGMENWSCSVELTRADQSLTIDGVTTILRQKNRDLLLVSSFFDDYHVQEFSLTLVSPDLKRLCGIKGSSQHKDSKKKMQLWRAFMKAPEKHLTWLPDGSCQIQ